MKKTLFILLGILLLSSFLYWVYIQGTKPLPGVKQADLGREHIEIGKSVDYNSEPPTSGPHYVEWVKAGIYQAPRDDRNLVHSLEHGYVIVSYNCDFKVVSRQPSAVREALAHGEGEEATNGATFSGELPESFKSEDCQKLVEDLTKVYEKKKLTTNNEQSSSSSKLIVVPHLGMDTKIALTAWTYVDKFNPSTSSGLSDIDKERIVKFIDAHRGMGPEKTME